jgi:Lon protease-like protein
MADLLPLFPLPNVVLFPGVFLPLHIFEPRYREMIADALAGDRLIGMVLLRPGWEADYDGRPPVFPIGCSGVITHVEQSDDGRYNIVLRGLERFRIVEENHERSYRRAAIDTLPEQLPAETDRAAIMSQRARLEELVSAVLEQRDRATGRDPAYGRTTAALTDEDLVHALAQYLDLDPLEKQALLQHDSLRRRAESLAELLEMKLLIARLPNLPNVAH